ncbi:MAG: hypothetical protein FK733_18145 [Asgard group archaeon]|nr:hypothetical protein [Asgard group archaeon]
MMEQNPRNADEALSKAIELLMKQMNTTQDHILERTAVVPAEIASDIASKYQIHEEIAKVVFVLEFEYNLPQELSVDYFKYEMQRLADANFQLPEIHTFLIQFALEEGFWIKYITNDFIKKIKHKLSKLHILNRSLFGDLEGNIEDSALFIIERSFLISEFIRPMLHTWIKEHQRSTYYDAALSIICGISRNPMEKGKTIINDLCQKLDANFDSIKEIIIELKTKAWAQKAITELDEVQQELRSCQSNHAKMSWRIVAEIILENCLTLECENLDEVENQTITKETVPIHAEHQIKSSPGFEAKKDDIVKDKITLAILSLDSLTQEKQEELIRELILENFDKAMKVKRQKPMHFAKEFLGRILEEFAVSSDVTQKIIKKFDNKLLYHLSPMGSKEMPDLSVDDKVVKLLEESVLENLAHKSKLQETSIKEESQKQTAQKKTEQDAKSKSVTITKTEDKTSIRNISEKELWIIIRDSYLKELFDYSDEIVAGSKVLKKFSLELGLLLTENEATNLITQELEKKGITIEEGISEDLDKNICIIILNQLKEQKQYQTKIN